MRLWKTMLNRGNQKAGNRQDKTPGAVLLRLFLCHSATPTDSLLFDHHYHNCRTLANVTCHNTHCKQMLITLTSVRYSLHPWDWDTFFCQLNYEHGKHKNNRSHLYSFLESGHFLRALHVLTHLIFITTPWINSIIIPSLLMRNLRLKHIK